METTKLLFHEDPYCKACDAHVLSSDDEGIELNQTIFYYTSGGQPGDFGTLTTENGATLDVIGTIKSKLSGRLIHIPTLGSKLPKPGEKIFAQIDWRRRYQLMKMHSCLHLLSAVIKAPVTGGQVGEEESRLDFDLMEANLDKSNISNSLNTLIKENHPISSKWISDKELESDPSLVKTMSVAPPKGAGIVRLIDIKGTDIQACGGTHVQRTGEIGQAKVTKIKNKGRHNRRISITLIEGR